MSGAVLCHGCGRELAVPAGHARSKLQCDNCGVICDLPRSALAAKPKRLPPAERPAAPPPRPLPARQSPPPPAPAPPALEPETLLSGSDDPANDLPYTVRGDAPVERCPDCRKPLQRGVAVCAACGYNRKTGEKAARTFELFRREWESGWPLRRRLGLFACLQVVNLAAVVVSYLAAGSAPVTLLTWLVTVAAQAFLLGTFARVTLSRSRKGQVQLAQTWRVGFVARPPAVLRWREHESVVLIKSQQTDVTDWWIFFVLLFHFVVPALLWWWHVIRPDSFDVCLTKDHGHPETLVHRGRDEAKAEEIATAIHDLTGLPYNPVA